jgi:hypothetical protein
MKTATMALIGAVAWLLPAAPAAAQDAAILAEFDVRVAAYVVLQREVRRGIEPEHIVDPHIREVSGALLAARLRVARAEAQPGDIFTPAIREILVARVRRAVTDEDIDWVLMDLYRRGLPRLGDTIVNASYPPDIAVRPPREILAVLPALPNELGYRLIGRDVVLWDELASIVVDVLPLALNEPQIWRQDSASRGPSCGTAVPRRR